MDFRFNHASVHLSLTDLCTDFDTDTDIGEMHSKSMSISVEFSVIIPSCNVDNKCLHKGKQNKFSKKVTCSGD